MKRWKETKKGNGHREEEKWSGAKWVEKNEKRKSVIII